MPEQEVNDSPEDFDAEMVKLIAEAEKRSHLPEASGGGRERLASQVEPYAQSVVALARALSSNSQMIKRVEERCVELAETNQKLLASLEEKKGVNKALFDAMHEEMKGYRDGFLFDALQKPFVRDLIGLYDDLSAAHLQSEVSLTAGEGKGRRPHGDKLLAQKFDQLRTHVEHMVHHVLELLSRMDVEKLPPSTGKHNRELQRAVKIETTETPDQDSDVIRSLRPGFTWRGRLLRPEEVVIRRYNPESG